MYSGLDLSGRQFLIPTLSFRYCHSSFVSLHVFPEFLTFLTVYGLLHHVVGKPLIVIVIVVRYALDRHQTVVLLLHAQSAGLFGYVQVWLVILQVDISSHILLLISFHTGLALCRDRQDLQFSLRRLGLLFVLLLHLSGISGGTRRTFTPCFPVYFVDFILPSP